MQEQEKLLKVVQVATTNDLVLHRSQALKDIVKIAEKRLLEISKPKTDEEKK